MLNQGSAVEYYSLLRSVQGVSAVIVVCKKCWFRVVGDNQAAWALSLASARSHRSPCYRIRRARLISSINNSSHISSTLLFCEIIFHSSHAPRMNSTTYTLLRRPVSYFHIKTGIRGMGFSDLLDTTHL